MFGALRAGASGFLLEDAPGAELVHAVSRMFPKLGLRDRAQAVVFAYESGLVSAGR